MRKIPLEYKAAFSYIEGHLNDVNAISSFALELTDFEEGTFYALVDERANQERLYLFKESIRQVQGKGKPPSEVLADYILEIRNSIPSLSLICDDFEGEELLSKELEEGHPYCRLYKEHGVFCEGQLHYFFRSEEFCSDLLEEAIRSSFILWHSLVLLSEENSVVVQDNKISLASLQLICSEIRFLAVEAYDGEGCVCWEKQQ